MADDIQRVHEPTPYRRELARRHGPPVRSVELVAAATLLAGLAGVLLLGNRLIGDLAHFVRGGLAGPARLSADTATVVAMWDDTTGRLAGSALALLLLIAAAAVLMNLVQVGLRFSAERLAPDWRRINPLLQLERLFSLTGSAAALLAAVKLAAVAAAAVVVVYTGWGRLMQLPLLEALPAADRLREFLIWTGVILAGVLLLVAVGDYLWLRWRHEQSLRMTPQELREEAKQQGSDPQITHRRRKLYEQRAGRQT
jgi:flagellar biosynthesis protein FlhB